MERENWSEELDIAVRLVHMACSLCRRVQEGLVSSNGCGDEVKSKDDDSLVTIADWSVQATVSIVLSESFGTQNLSIVAEEDTQTLSNPESAKLLESVSNTVNECLTKAPNYGLKAPSKPIGAPQILEAIGRCNSAAGPTGRHWVLDPVDGTLGFVRGDQYAVALALIEDGEVVVGVLGCPNYPLERELLSYRGGVKNGFTEVNLPSRRGCVIYAASGKSEAWMQPLMDGDEGGKKFDRVNPAELIRVSKIDDPGLATCCEPVEVANSNHSFSRGLVHSVGLRTQPLRVHSMVKYAAIARGDAEIFMKFAKTGYKEKIWDHAAGVLIVEQAGGVVTDARGQPLDFSKGVFLEGLDRGIIVCSGRALHQKLLSAVYASWDSSNL